MAKKAPRNKATSRTQADTRDTWTIMIYLSGDNNLSPEMVRAINEIAVVGVPAGVAITIQYDPLTLSSPTFRYALRPRTKPVLKPHVGGIPLADLAEAVQDAEDATDPKVLARFIEWSVDQFPSSKNRMLVLSGHGSGAIGDFLSDDHTERRRSRSLTIPRLRRTLEMAKELLVNEGRMSCEDHLIHVLGMDSCLMSMAEVGYEISAFVEFLVGSEGFVPNAGWPYGQLLDRIRHRVSSREALDPASVSRCLVDDVLAFYRDYLPADISVDMAACRLDGLGKGVNAKALSLYKAAGDKKRKGLDVTTAVSWLTNELLKPGHGVDTRPVQNAVILAHWRAQSFKFEQHADLWDFCDQLEDETKGKFKAIADACHAVKDAVDDVMGKFDRPANTPRQDFVGIEFQHAHGLSVYFPWRFSILSEEYSLTRYGQLQFAAKSGWGEFLAQYVRVTRRPERERPGVRDELTKWPPGEFVYEVVKSLEAGPGAHRTAAGLDRTSAGIDRTAAGMDRTAAGLDRTAAGLDRTAAGLDRFLVQSLGGKLPWTMKNAPQQVLVPTESLGAFAQQLKETPRDENGKRA